MAWSPRNVLSLSDIHFGHPNTPAKDIVDHLKVFFNHFKVTNNFDDLKLIIIAGDLWDQGLSFQDDAVREVVLFWGFFTRWCERKGISLLVIEGTPKHDSQQSGTLEVITRQAAPDLKFRYVKELSIVYLEELDLNVLVVPDECRPTAEQVQRDVMDLLSQHQLKQVDIAAMHGMFRYQLGSIPMNPKVHHEAFYLEIVRYFIVIGHIHVASQYEGIYAQGSFDRLAHGEEGDKGAFYFQEPQEGVFIATFLKNTLAKDYVTLPMKGKLDDALTLIDNTIRALPDWSFVRLVGEKRDDLQEGLKILKEKYPLIQFSRKVLKEKETGETIMPSIHAEGIVLNRQTLTQVLHETVSSESLLTPTQSTRLYQLLESLHTPA